VCVWAIATWYSVSVRILRGYSTGKDASIRVRSPYHNHIRDRRLITPASTSIFRNKARRPPLQRGRHVSSRCSLRCKLILRRTHSLTQTHSLTYTQSHTHSLTFTHSHSLTHTLTHTHSLTQSHSLTHYLYFSSFAI
jgi:hypothetical protein